MTSFNPNSPISPTPENTPVDQTQSDQAQQSTGWVRAVSDPVAKKLEPTSNKIADMTNNLNDIPTPKEGTEKSIEFVAKPQVSSYEPSEETPLPEYIKNFIIGFNQKAEMITKSKAEESLKNDYKNPFIVIANASGNFELGLNALPPQPITWIKVQFTESHVIYGKNVLDAVEFFNEIMDHIRLHEKNCENYTPPQSSHDSENGKIYLKKPTASTDGTIQEDPNFDSIDESTAERYLTTMYMMASYDKDLAHLMLSRDLRIPFMVIRTDDNSFELGVNAIPPDPIHWIRFQVTNHGINMLGMDYTNLEFYKHLDSQRTTHDLKYQKFETKMEADKEIHKQIIKGIDEGVIEYLRSKTKPEFSQALVYGPQKKSQETALMQEILDKLLDNTTHYTFENAGNNVFYLKEGEKYVTDKKSGERLNFSEFIKNVNFNYISLSKEQCAKFEKIFHEKGNLADYTKMRSENTPSPETEKLEGGEKMAIFSYTSIHDGEMKKLLQGRLHNLQGADIGFILLEAAAAISGLNKLPDYEITGKQQSKFLYRFDENVPTAIIKARIDAVNNGGGITTEMGLASTSHTHGSESFTDRNIITIFENAKGKSIESLSHFHGDKTEREVLLPPTKVQWLHYKELHIGSGKSVHVFVARAVSALKTQQRREENVS